MPADALATLITRASAGMILTLKDRQHVGLLHCEFGYLLLNKMQDMIRNVNASFIILRQFSILRVKVRWCIQYIPRNKHTVFALLCFVVVIHWLIFPYPSGLLHWHCGNLTIIPVPAKQPWWIWINTSCELIMNDCITTTKQSTTKPCAYFLGYTVYAQMRCSLVINCSGKDQAISQANAN